MRFLDTGRRRDRLFLYSLNSRYSKRIKGCRRSYSVREEFVPKARTPQTNENHSAISAGVDNDAAMETWPLQQKCSIPKWAREGALRQSTEGWSQADYQLAWEQASSSDALKTAGGFIVFLANKILAEVGLNKSGRIWKGVLHWERKKPGKCPRYSIPFQVLH